jgi:hypothetical protein
MQTLVGEHPAANWRNQKQTMTKLSKYVKSADAAKFLAVAQDTLRKCPYRRDTNAPQPGRKGEVPI